MSMNNGMKINKVVVVRMGCLCIQSLWDLVVDEFELVCWCWFIDVLFFLELNDMDMWVILFMNQFKLY